MYGEFDGENNNTIAIYSKDSFVTHKLNVSGMGDIGVCSMTGFIEDDLIYSCGGGDGPFSHNSVYLLNSLTGDNTTLKSCNTGPSTECINNHENTDCEIEVNCSVNILDL
ncbi:MAG: hypothetical protein HOC78_01570 [Candidatus Komeilibacteria bacterium]|jgi:hypothetical protein|nr:hypothetical protein [Candidatus Komeilibacteria bacterium]